MSFLENYGEISLESLATLCQQYHIRKLALFGSMARGDFDAHSDVDILVEFAPDAHIGWEIIEIQDALSALFAGRPVDLVTYKALNRHFRESVLAQAVTLYEQR